MLQYIQVFELASQRGYNVSDYALNENGSTSLHPSESQTDIELAFLQKWLRQKHKLLVVVEYYKPSFREAFSWRGGVQSMNDLKKSFSDKQFLGQPYDMALLQGINDALQLI